MDDEDVTEVFEDHRKEQIFSMRQIRMMTNQIRKKIQSSSTEPVLHVSTCDGK